VSDHAWKVQERRAARLCGGQRYPANSGGRVDVEGPQVVAQVKHVRVLSLAALEALACEIEGIGRERGKLGVVFVKRRAGRGCPTPGLVVMTETVWEQLVSIGSNREYEGASEDREKQCA
jgi:hypothetical protein